MSLPAGPDAMAPGQPRRPVNRVRVVVSDERGRPLSASLARWLAAAAPSRARGIVHVALVSDARVRALNHRYRGLDYATDVLSFPVGSPTSQPTGTAQRSSPRAPSAPDTDAVVGDFLGDIVIARGVVRRQALAAGHPEATELRVLALHGLLHLLGYDHERDTGAMARLERTLLRRSGLRQGVIARR
jgi:probable rRNA maturation factor